MSKADRATRLLGPALLFQGGIIALALVLGRLLGVEPWLNMHWNLGALAAGLAATLPLAAGLLLMPSQRWRWARRLSAQIRYFLGTLFNDAPFGAIALVSLLAGIGEEMLFRGLIQDGLSQAWHPLPALLIASLLFGLAHAVSLAYWLLASLMGLYLGAVHLWSGNLLVVIIIHAVYDWVAIHFYRRLDRLP